MSDGTPPPIRVITYNTASGNPRFAGNQRAFVDLPFYQDIVRGRPDAPLLAGQEIGPEQAEALEEAARGASFIMVHAKRPGQGNLVLVPARFEVLERRPGRYDVSFTPVEGREARSAGTLRIMRRPG